MAVTCHFCSRSENKLLCSVQDVSTEFSTGIKHKCPSQYQATFRFHLEEIVLAGKRVSEISKKYLVGSFKVALMSVGAAQNNQLEASGNVPSCAEECPPALM